MTEQELTELDAAVARAMGLEPHVFHNHCTVKGQGTFRDDYKPTRDPRLQVDLILKYSLSISPSPYGNCVYVITPAPDSVRYLESYADHDNDREQALGVAICRAVIAADPEGET